MPVAADSREDELPLASPRAGRAILERPARGDATVGRLAEPFGTSQQAVSKT